MRIYNNYLDTIELAMKSDPLNTRLNVSQNYPGIHGIPSLSKGLSYTEFENRIPSNQLQPGLQNLSEGLGMIPNFNQKLGQHPDFEHLKYSRGSEKHYIVSLFLDIKGSTNLFKKYTNETVAIIINTIQRAAIHTCLVFGGYIQRLHGDGMFIYFGGKDISIRMATLRSLQFASLFTYFAKNDLKDLFIRNKIDPIFTRVGIDLGYDEDVVWSLAGIGDISEVTTCSLHTSLASKMQQNAQGNGIVVGEKVKREVLDHEDLFTLVCHRTNEENDRYIFKIPEINFNYSQYDLEWFKFLKRQEFIFTNLQGKIGIKSRNHKNNSADLIPIAIKSKPYLK